MTDTTRFIYGRDVGGDDALLLEVVHAVGHPSAHEWCAAPPSSS